MNEDFVVGGLLVTHVKFSDSDEGFPRGSVRAEIEIDGKNYITGVTWSYERFYFISSQGEREARGVPRLEMGVYSVPTTEDEADDLLLAMRAAGRHYSSLYPAVAGYIEGGCRDAILKDTECRRAMILYFIQCVAAATPAIVDTWGCEIANMLASAIDDKKVIDLFF